MAKKLGVYYSLTLIQAKPSNCLREERNLPQNLLRKLISSAKKHKILEYLGFRMIPSLLWKPKFEYLIIINQVFDLSVKCKLKFKVLKLKLSQKAWYHSKAKIFYYFMLFISSQNLKTEDS